MIFRLTTESTIIGETNKASSDLSISKTLKLKLKETFPNDHALCSLISLSSTAMLIMTTNTTSLEEQVSIVTKKLEELMKRPPSVRLNA